MRAPTPHPAQHPALTLRGRVRAPHPARFQLLKIVVSIVICGALSSTATSAIEGYLARRSSDKAKKQ